MRISLPWLLPILLWLIPWLLLAGLGAYCLWQNGELLRWLWLVLGASAAAWLLGFWLQKRRVTPFSKPPCFEPNRIWPPTAEAAWNKVEKIADGLLPSEYPIGDPGKLLQLAHRVIVEVARVFYPESPRAELKVPLPAILLILEKVSRDMRELLQNQVPASHLITVEEGLMFWRWKKTDAASGKMTAGSRGLWRRFRAELFDPISRYPLIELERWLLKTLVRKFGYYAILLYSGQLQLEGGVDNSRVGKASARDIETAAEGDDRYAEPLRILVAGQAKAGKSSLINALFGELRAPADVLPLTYALTPYRLERDGEFLGLVFDSPGYGDQSSWVEDRRSELLLFDLVLLVCSATHAGRAADARFLNTLHSRYAETPDRIMPPLVVAVTHIDLLRPAREWNPPYNVGQPVGIKETQIRSCMEEVAATLAEPLELVQAVCLKPGDEWNIEAVWTGIASQLPQARRARYLRCLKDARAREKWELIFRQLGNAGRLAITGIGKVWKGK